MSCRGTGDLGMWKVRSERQSATSGQTLSKWHGGIDDELFSSPVVRMSTWRNVPRAQVLRVHHDGHSPEPPTQTSTSHDHVRQRERRSAVIVRESHDIERELHRRRGSTGSKSSRHVSMTQPERSRPLVQCIRCAPVVVEPTKSSRGSSRLTPVDALANGHESTPSTADDAATTPRRSRSAP